MIYQAKPQRGGRSIPSNTNNPPQDPPSNIPIEPITEVPTINITPPVEIIPETPIIPITEVPTINITPPVEIIPETPIIPLTLKQRIISFIKKIFRKK